MPYLDSKITSEIFYTSVRSKTERIGRKTTGIRVVDRWRVSE